MNTKGYLQILHKDIFSVVIATIAPDGKPQTRIIDIMLVDDDSVYFIAVKDKDFYRQVLEQNFVSITGTTSNKKAITIRGPVRKAYRQLLENIFEENPYLYDLYPGDTVSDLEIFQIYKGNGEYLDLSQEPIFRDTFTLGKIQTTINIFNITSNCIRCNDCKNNCPKACIESGTQFVIIQENCIHCGKCLDVCPVNAVEKIEKIVISSNFK